MKKMLVTFGAAMFAVVMLMPVSAAAQPHKRHKRHHKAHHHHRHA